MFFLVFRRMLPLMDSEVVSLTRRVLREKGSWIHIHLHREIFWFSGITVYFYSSSTLSYELQSRVRSLLRNDFPLSEILSHNLKDAGCLQMVSGFLLK